MDKESNVEKLSGNLATALVATAVTVGAASFSPLVVFLPVLASAPAAIRQKERVDATLRELNDAFQRHEAQLSTLTDAQFQFTAELLNAVLRTVDQQKLDYLKVAIKKGALGDAMTPESATQLSRLLRDITANEARFLLEIVNKKTIFIDFDKDIGKDEICIMRGSRDHKLFSGLCTLGLAEFSQKYLEVDAYYLVDIAHELVQFLTEQPSNVDPFTP